MKCIITLFICAAFVSSSVLSYEVEPPYGVSHSSYPASPIAVGHGHGWGGGQGHGAAGSYYHYHVPLVGQQSHYPPQPQQSNDHHLHYLLPLLLIAALPLLLLPLLPLLLLPLGLSLLALLLPLLMMGGMMMMMMMDGGMMMMMMRNHGVPTRHGYNNANEARNFGNLVYSDISSLFTRYARSLDLDHCPERISCTAGSFLMPSENNGTFEAVTARTLLNFVEHSVPKGKVRQLLRHYKKAFWTGSKTGDCSEFKCNPAFRIPIETPVVQYPENNNGTASTAENSQLYGQKGISGLNNYWNYYGNASYSDNYKNYVNSLNYYSTESNPAVVNGGGSKAGKILRKKKLGTHVYTVNSVKYSAEETKKKFS